MIRGEDSDTIDSALDAAGETRQSEPVESSDVGACTIIEVNLHGRPGPRKGDARVVGEVTVAVKGGCGIFWSALTLQ